jgi:hypothetical protein
MFKFKKIASMALAAAMVFALAVPAFASGTTYSDKTSQSVTMKGATTTPKVQIQLPSGAALTNTFLLNPYKVGYTMAVGGGESSTVAASAVTSQVISPVQVIQNATVCKMQVDVTVTTTLGGNLKLMAADFADGAAATDTKNDAYLWCAMECKAAGTAAPTATSAVGSDAEKIVLKAGDVKKTNYLQTAAAASADAPNFIWIQFGGSMAEGPTTPWTDKDTATVALAFTFTPNPNAAPTTT